MKRSIHKSLILLLGLCAFARNGSHAQLAIPSDGSDGALVVDRNQVIDLSQAVTAPWDADNSANAGKGVYDPEKWAVVFKYSSVTIHGVLGSGSSTFTVGDIKDPGDLVSKLKGPGALAVYLRERLEVSTQEALMQWTPPAEVPADLQTALAQGLKAIIESASIWDAQRFQGITLRSEVQGLLLQTLSLQGQWRLNRMLLEDAYPNAIWQSTLIANLTFKNHPSRAPVVWLVDGDVEVQGVVDLSGEKSISGPAALINAEPGPGGFRGGANGPSGLGNGLGPGGGSAGRYASAYGNPQVMPLIGGSGGASGNAWRGGAGGGALLIAASGTVRINGKIISSSGGGDGGDGGVGSGGAVRVVANIVEGNGEINCQSDGRVRVETKMLSSKLVTSPETIAVPPNSPPRIWPPSNAPKVRILSVNEELAPLDPAAPLISSADIAIQNDESVEVVLETRDFPIEGVVELRHAGKFSGAAWVRAELVGGDANFATWKTSITFPKGFTTLQARITAP